MSKFFKFFLIATIAIISISAWFVTKPAENPAQTLTIGIQSGYPPFEFMDEEGKIVGFDIDIGDIIAKKLDKTLVVQDMEFDGQILALKQGKIDLILSGMNITSNRLKEISMVPYHGEAATSLSLIFWEKIPNNIHSLEDFAKHPDAYISVEAGAIPEGYLNKYYPNIKVKPLHGALAPLMDVKWGKSLANLVEPDVAEYLQKKHPSIKILTIPLPKEEVIEGFGIGVNMKNQELYKQVSEIIQQLKASGELKKLEEKWFKEDV